MGKNQQSNFKKQISKIQKFVILSLSKGQIFSILFIFLFPIISYSQVVEEIIQLDTTSETIKVIYQPSKITAYYTKKIAVFADDTSQIAIEKSMANNKQNGLYKVYYPNGRLKIKTVFGNGLINGEWTWYDQDGLIIVKGVYDEGVKHGYWAYKSLKIYGRYRKGKRHKKWYTLDANNKKIKTRYKRGRLIQGKGFGNEKVLLADTTSKKNDTLAVNTTQVTKNQSAISNEYEQAIDFLANNFIFRKTIKAHFKKEIQLFKKNYKRDVFQFVIEPNVPTMEINTFLNLSSEGKIDVVAIDSVLKADTEDLKNNFNQTNIQLNERLAEYSTNKEASVHVCFSEIKNQLLRIDVIWKTEKEVENNTYKILLYFNSEGVLKGAEYQK